jgi:hypothetical protein
VWHEDFPAEKLEGLKKIFEVTLEMIAKKLPREKVKLGKRNTNGAYDDEVSIAGKNLIPNVT